MRARRDARIQAARAGICTSPRVGANRQIRSDFGYFRTPDLGPSDVRAGLAIARPRTRASLHAGMAQKECAIRPRISSAITGVYEAKLERVEKIAIDVDAFGVVLYKSHPSTATDTDAADDSVSEN